MEDGDGRLESKVGSSTNAAYCKGLVGDHGMDFFEML